MKSPPACQNPNKGFSDDAVAIAPLASLAQSFSPPPRPTFAPSAAPLRHTPHRIAPVARGAAMASDGEEDRKEKEKDRRKRLAVSPIAKPLAGKKLTKKTLKVVKKGPSLLLLLPASPMYSPRLTQFQWKQFNPVQLLLVIWLSVD